MSSSSVRPSLSSWKRSVASDLHTSLRADSAPGGAHGALEDPVGNPRLDAGDAAWMAAKGGWLLRMAKTFVGEEAFR